MNFILYVYISCSNNKSVKLKDVSNCLYSIEKKIKNRVRSVIDNMSKLEDIDTKSKNIIIKTKTLKENTKKISWLTWWDNFKWWIIIVLGGILFILFILLMYVGNYNQVNNYYNENLYDDEYIYDEDINDEDIN